MRQIAHLMGWAARVLHAAGLEQQADEYKDARPIGWRHEAHAAVAKANARIKAETGQVVSMDRFFPREPDGREQIDEKRIPCPMCSI